MKPAPFDYSRPSTLDEALRILAALGADGKVLAGGQSLLPILSMRLASPHHLVDINRISELAYVRVDDECVRVGALARHAAGRARPGRPGRAAAARQALRLVAHPTIRNRGTTVGSIVHADPSGEMTAVISLLGGSVRLASARGERTVAAADFFLGPLESALEPGELALEASFPVLAPGGGTAFVEVARRHGDYAVCGVGALVELGEDGEVAARAVRVPVGVADAARARLRRRRRRRAASRRCAPSSIPSPTSTRAPTTAATWPACSPRRALEQATRNARERGREVAA